MNCEDLVLMKDFSSDRKTHGDGSGSVQKQLLNHERSQPIVSYIYNNIICKHLDLNIFQLSDYLK